MDGELVEVAQECLEVLEDDDALDLHLAWSLYFERPDKCPVCKLIDKLRFLLPVPQEILEEDE